uniref:Putative N-acetyltransferase n=1 Tax=termite gut metagenome TaxID=433724 RepID=S0DDL6_9ZZZZ
MEIRRAVREELPRLMEIYDAARAFMRSRGNNVQWVGGYPSRELVLAGIDAGEQYVCLCEGRVVATFWFAVAPEPTYARIYEGRWLDEDRAGAPDEHAGRPYGVVHRLGSDGTCKGVGAACLDWCFERCGNIRVDTHADNTVMQTLLERSGYTRCGVIFLADGTPRDAFQKI